MWKAIGFTIIIFWTKEGLILLIFKQISEGCWSMNHYFFYRKQVATKYPSSIKSRPPDVWAVEP
jgi:hypothetical protein